MSIAARSVRVQKTVLLVKIVNIVSTVLKMVENVVFVNKIKRL